jgi:hypothetical protein
MAGAAVELAVRFAGTLIAHRRVLRGERYVIGAGRGVDLPLEIPAVTLVDRDGVVRVPIGVEATYTGDRTELEVGHVRIEITRAADRLVVFPRQPGSWRIAPYLAAVLVLHVALVVIAMALDPGEQITIPVVRAEQPRYVHTKRLPPPPPPPKPRTQPVKRSVPAAVASAQEVATRELSPAPGILGSASLDDLSAVTGSKDLAHELSQVGPIYDEDAANAQNFGNSAGSFDPSKDRAFDSIKTGPYVTNRGNMGQNYRLPAHGMFREVERPPIMGLTCDDNACTTVGELDRFAVRDYVEKRYVEMVKCFERHARRAQSIELVLRFEIDSDGKPSEVSADSEASGFGRCLVRLVEHVKFPTGKPTQVVYPVAFWRT